VVGGHLGGGRCSGAPRSTEHLHPPSPILAPAWGTPHVRRVLVRAIQENVEVRLEEFKFKFKARIFVESAL
jgi:hypothetical protein